MSRVCEAIRAIQRSNDGIFKSTTLASLEHRLGGEISPVELTHRVRPCAVRYGLLLNMQLFIRGPSETLKEGGQWLLKIFPTLEGMHAATGEAEFGC